MENEALKFEGRLGRKRHDAEKLKLRLNGLRASVRNTLDPFEAVEKLKLDVAAEEVLEMARLQIELKAALETIQAIEEALGR